MHNGIHKGNDFPMLEGTLVPALFSGKVSGIDRVDDYPFDRRDQSGKNVGMRAGFMFENTFIDTGVSANAFHFSSIANGLSVGDYLTSGAILGAAGHTGAVSGNPGNHLHQEFHLHKTLGSPETYVPNPYAARQQGFLDFVGAPGLGVEPPQDPKDWWDDQNFWHLDRNVFYINANELYGGY